MTTQSTKYWRNSLESKKNQILYTLQPKKKWSIQLIILSFLKSRHV